MSMIRSVTFRGMPGCTGLSLRDTGLEVLEIDLSPSRWNVPLTARYTLYRDCGRDETREEFGQRLRYAVREFGHAAERELVETLTRMGHRL